MKILLSVISPKRAPSGPAMDLVQLYLDRARHYVQCAFRALPSEAKLLEHLEDNVTRTRPVLLLADSRGQQFSSEELAAAIGSYQDGGTQQMIFAIGPADGWSAAALKVATRTVAFGRITLPHELAAVVAAEQIYRALTIRSGHPYHSGH
jgi:23S rRNA (pseudouridine1915-N3)-methyltransferase